MIPNLFTKRQVNIYKYINFNGITYFSNGFIANTTNRL